MNAHQRRKARRKLTRLNGPRPRRLISTWAELASVPDSPTHELRIDVEDCNGWIKIKADPRALGYYLSTHTFYGSQYLRCTRLLQDCGFDVVLKNWDA